MKDYLCAIDIGSSLVRVLVGRSEEGRLDVLGVGCSPSRGVRAGAIVNIDATVQALREAVREAELMSGLVVEGASVNTSGRHLRGDNSRGVVAITNRERIVTQADVLRVIEGAQNIRIPADQEVIHVLSREFAVDDQSGVRDPVGMTGVRLEADVHIVTASTTAIGNLEKAVTAAGIHIDEIVMSSLASASVELSAGEKDLGVVLVDIGGGVVDVIVFLDGGVFYSAVLPLGGNHVTQDLSIGLKIPFDAAEMVKKTSGVALESLVDPIEKVELPGTPGRPARWILRQDIAYIVEPRMREIFELVDAELLKSGRKSALGGGMILTGGAALLEGSADLAEQVIGLPAVVASPSGVGGFADRVSGPEYATAVGLLRYMSQQGPVHRSVYADDERGVFARMRRWLVENF